MLVRLAYASRCSQPVDESLVSAILAKSREHNPREGITGVLCICQGGAFLQVLEGGREPVNRLYGRLLADARHGEVTLLSYEEIAQRRFAGWRMGRVDMERLNVGVVLKYSETPALDPFRISGKVVLALMEELMDSASIIGGS